jgi:hypothetical protein
VKSGSHIERSDAARRWHRQPIAWLGVLLAAASLAGIAATIVIASRSADERLPVADDRVLNVPIDRADADDAAGARSADHPGTSQ